MLVQFTCCNNCTKRTLGCHDNCPDRAVEKLVYDLKTMSERKQKYKDYDARCRMADSTRRALKIKYQRSRSKYCVKSR